MRIYFEPQDCEFIVYRLKEELLKDLNRGFANIQYEGQWEGNPFKNHPLVYHERLNAALREDGFPTSRPMYLTASATPRYEVREDGKVAQVYEVSLV